MSKVLVAGSSHAYSLTIYTERNKLGVLTSIQTLGKATRVIIQKLIYA